METIVFNSHPNVPGMTQATIELNGDDLFISIVQGHYACDTYECWVTGDERFADFQELFPEPEGCRTIQEVECYIAEVKEAYKGYLDDIDTVKYPRLVFVGDDIEDVYDKAEEYCDKGYIAGVLYSKNKLYILSPEYRHNADDLCDWYTVE